MIFLDRQRHIENVQHKEVLIERSKKKLEKSMGEDIEKLDKLNRILGNGITLQIYTIVSGHKR